MLNELRNLFVRDLSKIKDELNAYLKEEDLWLIEGEIKNSAGNLTMHICGNLKYFIGAQMGSTGYVRDRELEFNGRRNMRELIEEIDEAIFVVDQTLANLNPDVLTQKFDALPPQFDLLTGEFLLHLYGHLNWHLGQINYHRRILSA